MAGGIGIRGIEMTQGNTGRVLDSKGDGEEVNSNTERLPFDNKNSARMGFN